MKTITNHLIYFFLLIFFISLGTCSKKDQNINNSKVIKTKSNIPSRNKIMIDLHEIENKILNKDWEVVSLIETADNKKDALPLLNELYTNRDDDIRSIALHCILSTDTENISKILAKGLSDGNEDIRITSLQNLQTKCDKSILPQLIENLQNPDENIRGGVSLLIGSLNDTSILPTLHESWDNEADPEVKRSMTLACAKLGDSDKREEILSQFDVSNSELRLQAIEDFKYINDTGFSKRILPALDDTGNAYMINPANDIYSRVCDAAVTLIAFLNNNPFSFETSGKKIYTKEEIDEAKQFLQSLDKEH
jgi:HEAT repeat protein